MKRIDWLSIVMVVVAASSLGFPQEFGPWAVPVNLGAPVNTAATETAPAISKDGLSLYFMCADCAQGPGIYVSQRKATDEAWGVPQYVWAINQCGSFTDPQLSTDGHHIYLMGQGTSGLAGDTDIYVSRRRDKRDDFGWDPPERLANINTEWEEGWAVTFEDETTGETYLYFVSNRPSALPNTGDSDIYASILQPDETFSQPVLVPELSSSARDRHPTIRRDGLEIFFMSNREHSLLNAQGKPSFDIWTSTRASTSDPWSEPVNVDANANGQVIPNINTARHDGRPYLSFDGTTLYFMSAQRPGNIGIGCPTAATCYFDIWMTTREKLKANEKSPF